MLAELRADCTGLYVCSGTKGYLAHCAGWRWEVLVPLRLADLV